MKLVTHQGGDDTLHIGENMLITMKFGAFVRGHVATDCAEIWLVECYISVLCVIKVSLRLVPDSLRFWRNI